MKDYAYFLLLGEPTDDDRAVIAEINTLLQKMGSSIKLSTLEMEKEIGRTETVHSLYIHYNPNRAQEYLGRGAGRKRKRTEQVITVGAVRQMLRECYAIEVADKLGISKATLYRRLKKFEIEEQEDDCSCDERYF